MISLMLFQAAITKSQSNFLIFTVTMNYINVKAENLINCSENSTKNHHDNFSMIEAIKACLVVTYSW